MHELQSLGALPENSAPPILGHGHLLLLCALRERHEVSAVVGLPDHVVELVVLKDFGDLGNVVMRQELERLKLLLQLFDACGAHRVFLEAFHAEFSTHLVLRELRDTLAATPQFLVDGEASLGQRAEWHVHHFCLAPQGLAVLSQLVLHNLVHLIDFQHAAAVEVEAQEVVLEIPESRNRQIQDLRQGLTHVHQAVAVHCALIVLLHALEAGDNGALQHAPILQEFSDGCNCLLLLRGLGFLRPDRQGHASSQRRCRMLHGSGASVHDGLPWSLLHLTGRLRQHVGDGGGDSAAQGAGRRPHGHLWRSHHNRRLIPLVRHGT
mmetsp:Transcript_54711/g.127643  ORF Transcript_54711/g.127643 Transcript_54711/m.127643 type:complete len:322 (-) Transcript_54711:129-1094(-)